MPLSYITLLMAAALLSSGARAQGAVSPGDSTAGCVVQDQKMEIPAARIAEDLAGGKTVKLSKVIVTGSALDLSNGTIAGDFRLVDSVVRVPVILSFATFRGTVDMSGSCFVADVTANDSSFQKYWTAKSAKFQGLFNAHAMSVTPGASFAYAQFNKAASFSRTRFGGSANFWLAQFGGEASFLGANIQGQAVFQGAVFRKGATFERVAIAESAYFREQLVVQDGKREFAPGAQFHSYANFKAATIGGQANFDRVQFHDEVRMTALKAEEAYFREAKFYRRDNKDANDVYLNDAQIGVADFGGNEKLMVLEAGRTLNISGLTYKRLSTPPQDMLTLLSHSGPYYNRQPYKALETYHRDNGDISRANSIYYARRVAEAERVYFFGNDDRKAAAQPIRWTWDRVLRYSIGYGVEWRYPMYWFLAIMVAATLLLLRKDAIERNLPPEVTDSPMPPVGALPIIERARIAVLVALDLVIPKLKLPGAENWSISRNRVGRLPLTYVQASTAFKYAAWIITTVALSVFGFTDLIKD